MLPPTPPTTPQIWSDDPTNPMSISRMLKYVKIKLGATRLNPIELTDAEIVEDIWQEISFPTISTYLPYNIQYLIQPTDRLNVEYLENVENTVYSEQSRHKKFVYQIDPRLHIHSIQNVQYTDSYQNTMNNMELDTYNSGDAIGDPYSMAKIYDDFVIQSYFKDLFNSKITWNLLAKNQIEFNVGNDDGITFENHAILLTISTHHVDTITMESDMIETIRKLLLADVMHTIGTIRNRYSTLTTPQGQINLNGQSLIDKSEQLRSEALTEFQDIPPHEFFYWLGTD